MMRRVVQSYAARSRVLFRSRRSKGYNLGGQSSMFSENVMKFSTETPKPEEDTIVTLATETNVSIDDLGMSFSFLLHQMSQ